MSNCEKKRPFYDTRNDDTPFFPYLGTSDEQRTPDVFLNATFHFFINGAVQTTITSYDIDPVSIISRGWFDYPQVICR